MYLIFIFYFDQCCRPQAFFFFDNDWKTNGDDGRSRKNTLNRFDMVRLELFSLQDCLAPLHKRALVRRCQQISADCCHEVRSKTYQSSGGSPGDIQCIKTAQVHSFCPVYYVTNTVCKCLICPTPLIGANIISRISELFVGMAVNSLVKAAVPWIPLTFLLWLQYIQF